MGHVETPAPENPLGLKGVGEAGAIPAGAAFAQALEDALPELALEIREIPLSPDRLWMLIREAAPRPAPTPAAVSVH
jgi:aerobic carbon-monoxide dehydrogenase large subunit